MKTDPPPQKTPQNYTFKQTQHIKNTTNYVQVDFRQQSVNVTENIDVQGLKSPYHCNTWRSGLCPKFYIP